MMKQSTNPKRVAPRFIAQFDSSTGMMRALANCLKQEDFSQLEMLPKKIRPFLQGAGMILNRLPKGVKEQVYAWAGWIEAISEEALVTADLQDAWSWWQINILIECTPLL